MPNFDSGVSKYIIARAVVQVAFPVDWKNNAEIACKHCPFYVRATQRCALNQQIVNFPDKFVGDWCPLEEVTEDV
jgi:hypothetical protein